MRYSEKEKEKKREKKGVISMEISRDLPGCIIRPQPTTLPRAIGLRNYVSNIL
jgi:hypothetical protein